MIFLLLFVEFFKIGLFAIGGGLVTIPFLFDLSERYGWFSTSELADMIAISESTPGPIGVNMATYAGFSTADILGGAVATIGLVMPSVIIIIFVAKLMEKYSCNIRVQNVLEGLRPAVLGLILYSVLHIAKIAITDNIHVLFFVAFLTMIRLWKKSPLFYLTVSALLGIALKL
jgi:chromate transporter